MNCLIVFLRSPVLGKVKTRLAEEIGPEKALEVYRILIQTSLDLARSCEDFAHVILYFDQKPNEETGFLTKTQAEGDLGQKMHVAIISELSCYQKVILIGSDCPAIRKEDIDAGFEALNKHDVVLGPAEDGGYYLIGMKEPQPEVFGQMTWSTDQVFFETMNRLKSKSVFLLDPKRDVDRVEDLSFFKNIFDEIYSKHVEKSDVSRHC